MQLLPFSRSQFDKLGKRLASGAAVNPDDLAMLERVYQGYAAAMNATRAVLEKAGHAAVVRLKTTGTLIDKLRRQPQIAISSINDIAGARIIIGPFKIPAGTDLASRAFSRDHVLRPGRLAQTLHASQLAKIFAPVCSKAPAKLDRRVAGGTHGYRAVHIIVYLYGLPVEVQLRTPLQHAWAEVSERLGDRWGRGLRYGEGPEDPERPAFAGSDLTRADIVAGLRTWSDSIDAYERAAEQLESIEIAVPVAGDVSPEVIDEMRTVREQLNSQYEEMQATLRVLLQSVDHME